MKILKVDKDTAQVELTREEVLMIWDWAGGAGPIRDLSDKEQKETSLEKLLNELMD